jgi:hypothetical protein
MRGATLEILDDTLETEKSSQEALEREKKDLDEAAGQISASIAPDTTPIRIAQRDEATRRGARDDVETMRKQLEDLQVHDKRDRRQATGARGLCQLDGRRAEPCSVCSAWSASNCTAEGRARRRRVAPACREARAFRSPTG